MSKEPLSERKRDHIDLTNNSQTLIGVNNPGEKLRTLFDYEPMLSGFPPEDLKLCAPKIAMKQMKVPLWVSSMTGGTGPARAVNHRLATICSEFGFGMGLGSCRSLLESDEFFDDFALRPILGEACPFFANIGLAQVVELLETKKFSDFIELCKRLKVDGFFIHVNPLQEWHQPEGDRWSRSPLSVIEEVLELLTPHDLCLGVKEVGQGMGPRSLEALMCLPLEVIEFAAFGGTNFSYLEQLRAKKDESALSFVGHSAQEMLDFANNIITQKAKAVHCKSLIISGGVRSALEGFYMTHTCKMPAAYGMASPFLQAATQGEEELRDFVQNQVRELQMITHFLHCK